MSEPQKKRILIFAHYYAPDAASTGQILQDMAEGMRDEFDVTVICVVPSYGGTVEGKYKTQRYYFEELNGVRIIRWIDEKEIYPLQPDHPGVVEFKKVWFDG